MDEQPRISCKYCGKLISPETNFCWYCTRELVARPERPEMSHPAPKHGLVWVLLALAGVVGIILVLARSG